jgi:ketosteroid isomerase-like protein
MCLIVNHLIGIIMRTLVYVVLSCFVVIVGITSCLSNRPDQEELLSEPYLSVQEEITEVINSIIKDAEEANIEGLKSAHLESVKFSKFGPRNFNRQDVTRTNETETAFFGSITNYKQEVRDLKIDVFDDVAVATYYPHVTYVLNGEEKQVSGRQTFVFLNTQDGWKLVHEHGTPQQK